MTEIDIRKDRFTTREESGSWGHVANWYNQSKEISIVSIDTTHGNIEVYIDGKPVAPRQKPKPKPKPNRYVLPMEGTELADGTIAYAALDHTGVWTIKAYSKKQSAVTFHATVTQSDIDTAPKWVQVLERVEATDDEV